MTTGMVLLDAVEVRRRLGNVSEMTLWRRLQDERLDFPKPRMFSGRRRWLESELDDWISQQISED